MNSRRLLLLLAVFILAACRPPMIPDASAGDTASPPALGGREWTLVELEGSPAIPASGEGRPSLRFLSEESRVNGFSGCNSLSGPYEQSGSSLRFTGPLAMTRRACAERERNAQEGRFTRALESVDRYEISGGFLTLYAGDEPVARFE